MGGVKEEQEEVRRNKCRERCYRSCLRLPVEVKGAAEKQMTYIFLQTASKASPDSGGFGGKRERGGETGRLPV